MREDERQEVEELIRDEFDRRSEAKRFRNLAGNNYEDDDEDDKPARRGKFPCCFVTLVILALSVLLIIYFVQRIKGPLFEEWQKGKETLEQAPEKIQTISQEAKEKYEAGQQTVEDANYTVKNVEQKIDAAKNAYEKASELKSDVNELFEYTAKFME